jgi:hypothetical protein
VSETVERVARVLFVKVDNTWHSPSHPRCVEIARDILAEIREPTEAMTAAGEAAADKMAGAQLEAFAAGEAADVWRAMVDATLR